VFVPCAGGAENGYWEPPAIHPSTIALASVLAKVAASEGDLGSGRRERYQVTSDGLSFPALATIRGDDFIVRSTLDDATYASGRSGGFHWRQTSAGVVHLVESDVQGDDLDRWPTGRLALSPTCVVAGEANGATGPAWVLLDRREHDIPHWFYVDEATGAIVREVTREGTRVETTTFTDRRTSGGATLPYRYHVEGPGGALDVAVTSSELSTVPASEVAIPNSTSAFPQPAKAETLPTEFRRNSIFVKLRADGAAHSFLLDTGTPQIVITSALARRLHRHVALEHTLLDELSVGSETVMHPAIFSVDFGWDEGILGYDFLLGRIVHIDYRATRVEELPRDGFVPPADAHGLAINFDEGMPIVTARVGNVTGERFVLDTGSPHVVVFAHLLRRKHQPAKELDFVSLGGPAFISRYLEGPVRLETVGFHSLVLGEAQYNVASGQLQTFTSSNDAEFPIDGIIGTDLLSHLEWWFDAGGNRAWYRWQG
jgi:hypothetical protein